MADQNMALGYFDPGGQRLPKAMKTTSAVDDHKRVGSCSHLEARGVPAKTQGVGTRFW